MSCTFTGLSNVAFISGVGSRYTEESSGIRIKNITLSDDGEYTCRAEVETDGRYNERKISVLVHSEFSVQDQLCKLLISFAIVTCA